MYFFTDTDMFYDTSVAYATDEEAFALTALLSPSAAVRPAGAWAQPPS